MNLNNNKLRKKITVIFLIIVIFLITIPVLFYSYDNYKTNTIVKEKIKEMILESKKVSNEEIMKQVLAEIEFNEKQKKQINDKVSSENAKIYTKILNKVKEIKESTHLKEEEADQVVEVAEEYFPEDTPKVIITEKNIRNKKYKPKISIIIDDVTTLSQKNKILNIGYPITMSFLPPTPEHKNSAAIAQDLRVYMVHFPLQASSFFKSPEPNTLNINDDYEKIEQRVKELRNLYPKAIYTNNHTGSVFTQNEQAMDYLFKALVKYNFIFVDSRTSRKTLGQKYAKKYQMPYIFRNIFLDNYKNYDYIRTQLLQAIDIAKKHGHAIAIGHPYDITLKVLKESKDLLKDLDVVYIDKI